jgi:selenocysteine lyase/cysteine desulfurase
MTTSTDFPVLDRCNFLNHAAVAPIPRRGAEALRTFAEEAQNEGAVAWPRWARQLKAGREQAAILLAVPADEIGFVHNTTHGLLCIANSLAWRPGDNLVTAAGEFPANVQAWRHLRHLGVEIRRIAERPDSSFAIDDFAAAIDARTRLVAVSLVQYGTGFRMPAEGLADLCRGRGALLCLDAIQAVGALPTRAADLGCDILVADGHKWMLGIEGHGILWMRPQLVEQMNECMTGWVGRVRFWDYDDYEQPPLPSARRFEDGSYNIAAAVALAESLALINETGIETVWSRIEALTARLREGAARIGWSVASPRGDGRRSGIVTLTRDGIDPVETVKALDAQQIHVAARRGRLRVSPHFYNTADQIDALIDALSGVAGD